MLALKFPPINELIRWRDIFSDFNKVGLIAVLAAVIGIVHVPARRQQGSADGADRRAQPRRDRRRRSSRTTSSCRRWASDGLRLDAVPAVAVHLHLPLQHARDHPDLPDAGHRPHGHPAVPRADRVGHLQRRRLQAQGPRLHRARMVWPPGVPMAMRPLVGVIEFISTIIVRPFSLAVRLFANMLAGHMLLVTFAFLTNALFFAETKQVCPDADEHPAVLHADLPHRASKCWSACCRPTSSRSSPPCTSTPLEHPEH